MKIKGILPFQSLALRVIECVDNMVQLKDMFILN